MNAAVINDHPSIRYYDSDYPSRELARFPENFDDTTEYQGIAQDVSRYLEVTAETGGPVLELCCGTGRVSIPLARAGSEVTAVDLSKRMLDILHDRIAREEPSVAARLQPVLQDVCELDLPRRDFAVAIIPFNSLLLITDMDRQLETLKRATQHLRDGGLMAIDIVNPLVLPVQGDPVPKPFFTRRSETSGNLYTRFAALGPFDGSQRQKLFGWYDEIDEQGRVHRSPYSMEWRPIFRFELELMLAQAGCEVISIEGGHRREPFRSSSPKIFAVARKRPTP